MNINANSRFSQVPQVNQTRSKFDLSTSVKTSFNVGQLIPFYYEEVLPGDTFSVETNMIARMQPLVTPIMDDLFLDVYYFYVPNRICWDHWKEFMGEATNDVWYPQTEYNVPHVRLNPDAQPDFGSLFDYFGLPIRDNYNSYLDYTCSQLPFRMYTLIWNEWFRDQNLQMPELVDYGDSDVPYDSDQPTYGGRVLSVNKYHDYFTSVLPEPQKGPDVFLPLNGVAPVLISRDKHDIYFPSEYEPGVAWEDMSHFGLSGSLYGTNNGSSSISTPLYGYGTDQGTPQVDVLGGSGSGSGAIEGRYFQPDNLWADLSQTTSTSVNALRLALATQSFYEKNARGGTRYRELIKSHFGVTSPDGRMQVPELLNYSRVNININQVVQQSESSYESPLGTQAAYALTADSDKAFTKSFTEHGAVIGVMCARYKHSYQQGINKRFSRRTMFDYYFPVFANLGEQPVYNKEIFVDGYSINNEEVFGYQEAYSDYRYHPDKVTGEMRSNHPNSLDVWHLADWYEHRPYLSPDWIKEDKSNVDRVLSVTSEVSNQMWADIYIKNDAVRVMPMFSIPGLPRTL